MLSQFPKTFNCNKMGVLQGSLLGPILFILKNIYFQHLSPRITIFWKLINVNGSKKVFVTSPFSIAQEESNIKHQTIQSHFSFHFPVVSKIWFVTRTHHTHWDTSLLTPQCDIYLIYQRSWGYNGLKLLVLWITFYQCLYNCKTRLKFNLNRI